MFDLSGKVALVTGASRGIGRAIACTLAAQGATVVAAARGDHANEVVAALAGRGQRAEAATLDVTDAAAVEKLPGDIVQRHGRLDIVVSNAGITRDQLLMRMKRADWDAVIGTNLTATFSLAQAAMRPMLKQRGGRIIAIGSVVGQTGNTGQSSYAASKAGSSRSRWRVSGPWTMWRRQYAFLRPTTHRILQDTFWPSTAGCTCRRIE